MKICFNTVFIKKNADDNLMVDGGVVKYPFSPIGYFG